MQDYILAHEFSEHNQSQLLVAQTCGCFYCGEIFSSTEITGCIAEGADTVLCPHCGIDSVIGESSGFQITEEFISNMQSYWFW